MSINEQLRALGLRTFPCWVRHDGTKWLKGPDVPKGMSWVDYQDGPHTNWSSGVIGVVIPPSVVVLDLDTYKGSTRQAVEQWLGCPLEWDRALIQKTIGGGEHYAFSCDWDVRQLQSESDLVGLDTRAPGRGFICTGNGYSPARFGLAAMAYPQSLPPMPDAARAKLERVQHTAPTPSSDAPSDIDEEQIKEALGHIDPGVPRAEWIRIGLALRNYYKDNDGQGEYIFDLWSSGQLGDGETPENYVPEHIPHQWGSFKVDGGVTIATLFYKAIHNGWQPPATFDAAAAFGEGAARHDEFAALVERIRLDGFDIRHTQGIVEAIRASGCNQLQAALLAAELKAEIKDAGTKDKNVEAHIDSLLKTKPVGEYEAPAGEYGKSDAGNAATFQAKYFPEGRLIRSDGELYGYNGKVWDKIEKEALSHMVASDMVASRMQSSKINSCIDLVSKLAPICPDSMNSPMENLIFFNNGVLDLNTKQLHSHSMDYKTTTILPYDFDPYAQCPNWVAFLEEVMDGDAERIALLQEWVGYLLANDYRHHKILLLIGPPRSGKGTIGRILGLIIGPNNFAGGSLSSFAKDSFLEGLRTKSVLFIGDAEKKVSPNELPRVIERIKSISGNDCVNFDRKYISGLSTTLPTRFTIAANSVPALFDDSGALSGRIMPLPFYNSFAGREDIHLIDRLRTELPGIAIWALNGLERLRTNGRFTVPAESREEMDYINETYASLTRFIEESCIPDPEAITPSGDLYEVYRAWALAEGDDPLRRKTFVSSVKDAMRGHGVRYGVRNGIRGFAGLRPRGQVPDKSTAFKVVK